MPLDHKSTLRSVYSNKYVPASGCGPYKIIEVKLICSGGLSEETCNGERVGGVFCMLRGGPATSTRRSAEPNPCSHSQLIIFFFILVGARASR
jgi:hypothetical protein